jgi:murein DD-endopeptidase MepM/ murein hydrolase activator NlpD
MERLVLRPVRPALLVAVALLLALVAPPPARGVDSVPDPERAVWPLHPEPEVVSGFDPPTSRWGPGHRGVDLRAAVGQPVRAAAAGTVTFAGRLAGRGVVVVTHGRTRTTYEPVTASVRVGEAVAAGARIGRLELPGSHCLPAACLHWGLLEGERYLDPLTLVGGGPVRLLPWLSAAPAAPPPPTGRVPQLPGWRPLGQAALFRG